MDTNEAPQTLPIRILNRITTEAGTVGTPGDFVDVGSRDAVDKALQRMVKSGGLRRIKRGLYDKPVTNELTRKQSVPDYRSVIEAVARRDKARFVVDGVTAASALGLTNAVPAKIEVLADARLKPIDLEPDLLSAGIGLGLSELCTRNETSLFRV